MNLLLNLRQALRLYPRIAHSILSGVRALHAGNFMVRLLEAFPEIQRGQTPDAFESTRTVTLHPEEAASLAHAFLRLIQSDRLRIQQGGTLGDVHSTVGMKMDILEEAEWLGPDVPSFIRDSLLREKVPPLPPPQIPVKPVEGVFSGNLLPILKSAEP